MNYEKLSRQALKCMLCRHTAGSILTLAILGAVAILSFPKDLDIAKSASLAAALLILINMLVSPYFRYHRYRYRIDKECIDIHEGYLFTKRNIVPIERLHKLQTTKGPIDQFFGVSTVVVTTAGGDVAIRLLDEKKAEEIADSLRHRINQIVTEQRSDYGNTY